MVSSFFISVPIFLFGEDELVYLDLFKDIIADKSVSYNISYLTGFTLDSLLEELSELPEHTAIIYLPLNTDAQGNSYKIRNIFPLLTDTADAPVFSFFDSSFGFGVVGGSMTSARLYGEQAADTVVKLLNNSDLSKRIETGVTSLEYDWRQLQRWGIDEKNLPEGSKIFYRADRFIEKYKKQIISISIFLMLQTLLIIALVINLMNRKKAEQMLVKSEDLLQRSERSAGLGGWDYDLINNSIYYTDELRNIFGTEPDKIMDINSFADFFHLEEQPVFNRTIDNIIKTGKPYEEEFRILSADGGYKWLLCKGEAVMQGGRVVRISGTMQDISHKKKYELEIEKSLHQKEVLLQEIHHRVNNNLAIIVSLLSMQTENIDDARLKRILTSSCNRVNSMALIHENIYMQEEIEKIVFSDYIRSLAGKLVMDMSDAEKPVNIEYDLEEYDMKVDYLVSIGLILNEIITNSLMHAFSETEEPLIKIFTRYESFDNRYIINISDNGNGVKNLDGLNDVKTIGFLLVHNLVKQIDGQIEYENNQGFNISISFKP